VLTGKLPPAMFGLFMQQMRLRAVRRLPIAFGWLTIRGDAATARWMKPVLTQPEIRRDAVRVLRAAAKEPKLLREAAGFLPGFNRPALVIWASEDRVMPPEHGQRLAKLLPQGQLAEIEDSYTLIPLDQPARLAQLIREFTHAPGTLRRGQNRRSEHVEDRDRDRRESGAGAGPCARAVPHAGNRRHHLPDGA
jgi:pimeloyl-ACP methyl ester carboxylesterase